MREQSQDRRENLEIQDHRIGKVTENSSHEFNGLIQNRQNKANIHAGSKPPIMAGQRSRHNSTEKPAHFNGLQAK